MSFFWTDINVSLIMTLLWLPSCCVCLPSADTMSSVGGLSCLLFSSHIWSLLQTSHRRLVEKAHEHNILEKYFIIPWFLNKIIFRVLMGDGLRAVLCGGKKNPTLSHLIAVEVLVELYQDAYFPRKWKVHNFYRKDYELTHALKYLNTPKSQFLPRFSQEQHTSFGPQNSTGT